MHYSAHMSANQILQGIADVVRQRRKQLGATARTIAEQANLSPRFYAQIEKGEANISIVRLEAVANALNISLPDLISRAQRGRSSIALLGIRGAGKSSVGPLLASARGLEFVELDASIESKTGLDLREIFSLHGEDYYRRMEIACLEELLEKGQPVVIALSGGVVQNIPAFERVLEAFTTVWLKAEPEDYMQRVLDQGDHRPIANRHDAMSELHALVQIRAPQYMRASLTVDTSGLTAQSVSQYIENNLPQRDSL
jgi:XRE family transcriptional regulator, aerobic/anaerobic benzoate catabolism transcriptional regulator